MWIGQLENSYIYCWFPSSCPRPFANGWVTFHACAYFLVQIPVTALKTKSLTLPNMGHRVSLLEAPWLVGFALSRPHISPCACACKAIQPSAQGRGEINSILIVHCIFSQHRGQEYGPVYVIFFMHVPNVVALSVDDVKVIISAIRTAWFYLECVLRVLSVALIKVIPYFGPAIKVHDKEPFEHVLFSLEYVKSDSEAMHYQSIFSSMTIFLS